MGFMGKVKRGFNKIGKGIRAGGRTIGKVLSSKKFKTGLKVAGGIALAAGAIFAGLKAKEAFDEFKGPAQETVRDIQEVRGIIKKGKKIVKEGKRRKENVMDIIQEVKSPGNMREKLQEPMRTTGESLTELNQAIQAPEASGILETIGAVTGISDKKTPTQKAKASESRSKLIGEIKERKAKLIQAEEGGVLPNVVAALTGQVPKIKTAAEDEEQTSFFGRLSGFFAPDVDFDHDWEN